MSDIDLTEAVEAWIDGDGPDYVGCSCCAEFPDEGDRLEALARQVLTAALHHIERQVREQVAQEIEAERVRRHRDHVYIRSGLSIAVDIARGDS